MRMILNGEHAHGAGGFTVAEGVLRFGEAHR